MNESELKRIIENRYPSVRAFALENNIPYTTMRSILERGIMNAKAETVFKICSALGLRPEAFTDNTTARTPVQKLDKELNKTNHADWVSYGNNLLDKQKGFNAVQETPDKRFGDVEDVYKQLSPEQQKEAKKSLNGRLRAQNITKAENIKKAQELYSTLGDSFGDVSLYGEVSAGTGVYLGHEITEVIKYPEPIPDHDIALRVHGNSMTPLFQDGEVIFVRKTSKVHHGQIIIIIVNNEAYIKKLYRKGDDIRLISLNKDYDDIILKEDDEISIVGEVIN